MTAGRRRRKRFFSTLITIVFVLFLLAGALYAGVYLGRLIFDDTPGETVQTIPSASSLPELPEAYLSLRDPNAEKHSDSFYYGFLNEEEQRVYECLLAACLDFREEMRISPLVSEAEFLRANSALSLDHPEFYWAGSSTKYYVNRDNMVTSVTYGMNGDERETLEKIDALTTPVCESLPDREYDAYRMLYEYVIDLADYDGAHPEQGQTIKSVFVNHRSVCAGYSRAFEYLCRKAGLECVYVTGTAVLNNGENGSHAWNLIRIQDQWYWCDVTWGDPVFEGQGEGEMNYNYFCVSDRELTKEHVIDYNPSDLSVEYPSCPDDSLNWYVLNQAYFETYDEETMRQYVTWRASEGMEKIVMKFSNQEELGKAVYELIEQEKIFRFLNDAGMMCHSLSYVKFEGISAMWIVLHPDEVLPSIN